MTTGIIIGAVVLVVLIAAAALYMTRRGPGSGHLRRRFGPEYERTLARHDGDRAAADKELQERVDRHGHLKQRPLEARRTEEFRAEWAALQERFVDSPAESVREASGLLDRLARERGFPAADSGEQIDALSVHRPRHLQAYRDLRGAALTGQHNGDRPTTDTEDLRARLLEARALFDDLVAGGKEPRHTARGRHDNAERADVPSGDAPSETESGTGTDGDAATGHRGTRRPHLPSGSNR
ncbi:hypothetical protein ACIP98_06290 [Streptomyces sp. NPDC088354]|uniref:hypothetical protein n=1 Tax=Streptomyces sp. NPDC088354 TaxID=3365856 RepID=UPI0037F9C4F6